MGDINAMIRKHKGNIQETIRTSPRFTVDQISAIDKLIGSLGKNRSDVIKTLVIMWLTQNGKLEGSDFK